MSPTASILILTYNHPEYTRLCLESIFAETEAPDFEVIVLDNASQDGTRSVLEEQAASHPNLSLIFSPENLGFAGGNNQAAAAARGEYLVFLNNDVVVTRGWLSSLIRRLQDPAVGMVGPVTNRSGNESRIRVDYETLEDMPAFARRYISQHAGQEFEIRMLAFLCVALRRSVFAEIGPLDERFGIGMFEDDDYALRLKERGYKTLCAEDSFVHHWGSAGFSSIGFHQYWRLFAENRQKFEAKWGQEWQPPRYRDELLDEQIAQLVKEKAQLAAMIIERDQAVEKLNAFKEKYLPLENTNLLKIALRLRRIQTRLAALFR